MKNRDLRPTSCFISEMIQHRAIFIMEDEYERPSDISNGDITGSDISTSNSSKNGPIKMIDLQRQADSKSFIQGQSIYRYH